MAQPPNLEPWPVHGKLPGNLKTLVLVASIEWKKTQFMNIKEYPRGTKEH